MLKLIENIQSNHAFVNFTSKLLSELVIISILPFLEKTYLNVCYYYSIQNNNNINKYVVHLRLIRYFFKIHK